MTNKPRIEDLVRLWRERTARGEAVSLEALCSDCPELLPELRDLCQKETVDYPGSNATPSVPAPTISAAPPATPSGQTTVGSLPSLAPGASNASSMGGGFSSARVLADWIAAHHLVAFAADDLRALAVAFPDPRVFGKELVGRGIVTPFQINRLLQGRGKELLIGPYVLLEKLGEGGMGIVYKARHRDLKRVVALKMILGASAGSGQLSRFRLEAEAVARLQHPHIVQIFEVGTHEGKPFFALEYVEGGTLKEVLDRKPQPPRACAELLETIARAIHGAHQQGILHRDLKPANILTQFPSPEGKEAGEPRISQAIPKVADFGLAKKLDEDASGQTHSGAIMGTPSYMAPEQAAGRIHELGPATDVYALGAILYEMLTGGPPFKEGSVAGTVEKVLNEEPVRPRSLAPAVPPDLETICLKCLEKDPARRYDSAAELAQDLRRFLDDEPIRARRSTRVERALRWMRRRPALTAAYALSLLAILLLVGAGVAYRFYREAEAARVETASARDQESRARGKLEIAVETIKKTNQALETAQEKLERLTSAQQIQSARKSWMEGRYAAARNLLDACSPTLRDWEWHYLNRWFKRDEIGHEAALQGLSFCAEGRFVASSEGVWDLKEGKRLLTKEQLGSAKVGSAVVGVALSPDGKTVAAGQVLSVRLIDVATGKERSRIVVKDAVLRISFHRGGALILGKFPIKAGAPGLEIPEVRDPKTGDVLWTAPPEVRIRTFVACQNASLVLATCDNDRTLRLFDWEKKEEIWKRPDSSAGALAISPDGSLAAVGREGGVIEVLRTADAKTKATLRGPTSVVQTLAFSPDNTYLASSDSKGPPLLWDLTTRKVHRTLRGAAGAALYLSFSPDGSLLAASSDAPSLKLWDLAAEREVFEVPLCKPMRGQAFHPGGHLFHAQDNDFGMHARQVSSGQRTFAMPVDYLARYPISEVFRVNAIPDWKALSPDGRYLARWTNKAREVLVRSVPDGKTVVVIEMAIPPNQLVFSDDGARLAVADDTGVGVYSVSGGEKEAGFPCPGRAHDLAFSGDGRTLARRGRDLSVTVWDLATRKEVLSIPPPGGAKGPDLGKEGLAVPPSGLALNADGTLLATLAAPSVVGLWHVRDGKRLFTLAGHEAPLSALTFHPGGTRLASLDFQGMVRLWDIVLGQEVMVLPTAEPEILETPHVLCFSQDGKRLLAGPVRHSTWIWETENRAEYDQERRALWPRVQASRTGLNKLDPLPGEASPVPRYAALFHYDWSLKRNGDPIQTLLTRASFHAHLTDWKSAAEDLQALLERDPGNENARFALGVALLSAGRRADYLDLAREAWAKTAPAKRSVQLVRLVVLDSESIGAWEEALAVTLRERDTAPVPFPVEAARGMVLFRVNRHEEALAAFDRAAALRKEMSARTGMFIDSLDAWALACRAMTLHHLGRPADAGKALKEAVQQSRSERTMLTRRPPWEARAGGVLLVQEAERLIGPGK